MQQRTKYYGPGPYKTFQMYCLGCKRKWWSQPRTEAPKRCPAEGCRSREVSTIGARV